MADAIPDLWPDIEQSQVIPPVAILREQAAALGKKTNYLLVGRVDTRTDFLGKFVHAFSVTAPALDDYTYKLFEVTHGADQYPVEAPPLETRTLAPGPPVVRIDSEKELLEYIRKVLNSDKTKKIVGSLLAQVKATT